MHGERLISCCCAAKPTLFSIIGLSNFGRPEQIADAKGTWTAKGIQSCVVVDDVSNQECVRRMGWLFGEDRQAKTKEYLGRWMIIGVCPSCTNRFAICSTMSHAEWEKNPLQILDDFLAERDMKTFHEQMKASREKREDAGRREQNETITRYDCDFGSTAIIVSGEIVIRRNLLDNTYPRVAVNWLPSRRGIQQLSISSAAKRAFMEECRRSIVILGIFTPDDYPDWEAEGNDDDFIRWADEVKTKRLAIKMELSSQLPPEAFDRFGNLDLQIWEAYISARQHNALEYLKSCGVRLCGRSPLPK